MINNWIYIGYAPPELTQTVHSLTAFFQFPEPLFWQHLDAGLLDGSLFIYNPEPLNGFWMFLASLSADSPEFYLIISLFLYLFLFWMLPQVQRSEDFDPY